MSSKTKAKPTVDVLGIGLISQDHGIAVPQLEADARVLATGHRFSPGGMAATAMATLAKLGYQTALLGAVGADPIGKSLREQLAAAGVDVSGVRVDKNAVTQTAICIASGQGHRSIIGLDHASAPPLEPSDLSKAHVALAGRARAVHTDGWHAEASVPLLLAARQAGVLTSVDAGWVAPQIEPLCVLADILFVSRDFAAHIAGKRTAERQLGRLLDWLGDAITRSTDLPSGTKRWVGITYGSSGSIGTEAVWQSGRLDMGPFSRQGAMPIDPVDTTGAGDVYHAALIDGHLRGLSLIEAMRWASAAAALACLALGAQTALPAPAAIKKALADW